MTARPNADSPRSKLPLRVLVGCVGAAAVVAVGFVIGSASVPESSSARDAELAELTSRLADLEAKLAAKSGAESRALPDPAATSSTRSRPVGEAAPGATPTQTPNAPAGDAARLARIESRLDQLSERTGALTLWAGGMAPPPRNPDVERDHFASLTDPALARVIQDLSRTRPKTDAERRATQERTLVACDVMLERNTTPEIRSQALTVKGIGQRSLGDNAAAERTLNYALALVSPESREGVSATTQLAFTAVFRKDFDRAAELFLSVYHQPDAKPDVRARFRRLAANQLSNIDTDRARAEFTGIVEEFGASDDLHVRSEVDQARTALERLDEQ